MCLILFLKDHVHVASLFVGVFLLELFDSLCYCGGVHSNTQYLYTDEKGNKNKELNFVMINICSN